MLIRVLSQRLIGLFGFFVLASIVIFLVVDVLPGDPATLMLGTDARPDTLNALRHQLGLDKPLIIQYFSWASGLVRLDFGTSMTYATPVLTLIAERLPISLPLAAFSLILTALIAIPFGALAGLKKGAATDRIIRSGMQISLAIPNIWLAIVLVLIFAVSLHWLPAGGFPGWGAGVWPAVRSLLLPMVALAVPQAAILARIVRAEVIDKSQENFVLGARARGLSDQAILLRHILPNAMLPVLSVMGLQCAFLIAGTVIVETGFSLPGLGRLIFQAINQRDMPVVKGVAMLLVGSVILINSVVDLAATLIDPRLRRRGEALP